MSDLLERMAVALNDVKGKSMLDVEAPVKGKKADDQGLIIPAINYIEDEDGKDSD